MLNNRSIIPEFMAQNPDDTFKLLMPLKLILDEEYDKYSKAYIDTKSNYYYKEHKEESWFKEKYDPLYISNFEEMKNKFCQNRADLFFEKFIYNHFENFSLTFSSVKLSLCIHSTFTLQSFTAPA